MTAERLHEYLIADQEPRPAPQLSEGVLIPIQERIEQRNAQKEQALLDSFMGYSKQTGDIDPRTMRPEDAPSVALAAHHFLAEAVQRRIDKYNPPAGTGKHHDSADAPEGRIYVIPLGTIDTRIKTYYQRFGTDRRAKSPVLFEKEISFLEQTTKPLQVYHYEYPEGADEEAPPVKRPRAEVFPEIGLALRLQRLLDERGNQLAADSVDAVLSAYGERFLTLAGRQDIVLQRENGQQEFIRRSDGVVRKFDIPNDPDLQAEEYNGPRNYKTRRSSE